VRCATPLGRSKDVHDGRSKDLHHDRLLALQRMVRYGIASHAGSY
jgi:hypothetical protein